MSSTQNPAPRAPITVPAVASRKVRDGAEPLVMVTAYDAPGARIASEAGVDLILVGDSLAMVVLGYDDTLQVTVDDMAHHTAAVARAKPHPLIVADLPWMGYHLSTEDSVRNAAQLIRAGAEAVKLEGGRKRLPMIEAILDAEIPVMGHLGLTPQSVHAMGGFKVQAKTSDAAQLLVDEAKALAHAGCFAIVLEGVPTEVATMVTDAIDVPHDRHRRRPRLRRPGARVPRRPRHRGPHGPQVRAPLRGGDGPVGGRHRRVCRRRPHQGLPRSRGELPPRRGRGRDPRPLRPRHLIVATSCLFDR